jgi:protein lifeguard
VALVLVFVCLIAMACCESVRRTSPMNFIFLGIFTVAQSFLLGVSSSVYDNVSVSSQLTSTAT